MGRPIYIAALRFAVAEILSCLAYWMAFPFTYWIGFALGVLAAS
jgi:hypothetical protein